MALHRLLLLMAVLLLLLLCLLFLPLLLLLREPVLLPLLLSQSCTAYVLNPLLELAAFYQQLLQNCLAVDGVLSWLLSITGSTPNTIHNIASLICASHAMRALPAPIIHFLKRQPFLMQQGRILQMQLTPGANKPVVEATTGCKTALHTRSQKKSWRQGDTHMSLLLPPKE
jgi:hypothetical protein